MNQTVLILMSLGTLCLLVLTIDEDFRILLGKVIMGITLLFVMMNIVICIDNGYTWAQSMDYVSKPYVFLWNWILQS